MDITLDTNIFGPVTLPDEYPTHVDIKSCMDLRNLLIAKRLNAYISEASLSLEALSHNARLDSFLRGWANKNSCIELLTPSKQRIDIL